MTILNTPGTGTDFIVTTVTIVTKTGKKEPMGKEKSVLIPMELFANLVKHHLLEIDGLEGKIRSGLEAKMNRFEEHQ